MKRTASYLEVWMVDRWIWWPAIGGNLPALQACAEYECGRPCRVVYAGGER